MNANELCKPGGAVFTWIIQLFSHKNLVSNARDWVNKVNISSPYLLSAVNIHFSKWLYTFTFIIRVSCLNKISLNSRNCQLNVNIKWDSTVYGEACIKTNLMLCKLSQLCKILPMWRVWPCSGLLYTGKSLACPINNYSN